MIHWCIIGDGASTYIISIHVLQNLKSPQLASSLMKLHAYDGPATQPQGLLHNVLIELVGKTVLINIEVSNARKYYNLLLGHKYMYTMKKTTSSMFRPMMFPHEGNIVKLD